LEEINRNIIAVIAFKLFRLWTEKAHNYNPDMDFTIIDETKLVDDLEQSLLKGIDSLQKNEKIGDRKLEIFDFYFLISFVRRNLAIF